MDRVAARNRAPHSPASVSYTHLDVYKRQLTACGQKESENTVYSIGISQYGEHASLDNCRIGFLQGLEEAGLVEGTDFTVDYQNAGFDDNIAPVSYTHLDVYKRQEQ